VKATELGRRSYVTTELSKCSTRPKSPPNTRLITTGTTEQALLVAVARLFPELTPAELSQALQVATTVAEKRAAGTGRHIGKARS
jgi:hypothetical protein